MHADALNLLSRRDEWKVRVRKRGGDVVLRSDGYAGRGNAFFHCGPYASEEEAWDALFERAALARPGQVVLVTEEFDRVRIPGANAGGEGAFAHGTRMELRRSGCCYLVFQLVRAYRPPQAPEDLAQMRIGDGADPSAFPNQESAVAFMRRRRPGLRLLPAVSENSEPAAPVRQAITCAR